MGEKQGGLPNRLTFFTLTINLGYNLTGDPYQMKATIDLRLFATLGIHTPENASQFPIPGGITLGQLIDQLPLAAEDAKLIFVNGVRADLNHQLFGGERVGIFPPVGGG